MTGQNVGSERTALADADVAFTNGNEPGLKLRMRSADDRRIKPVERRMSEPIQIAIFKAAAREPRIAITFQTSSGKQVGFAPDLGANSTLSESEKSSLKSALSLLRRVNEAITRKLEGGGAGMSSSDAAVKRRAGAV